jgi:hypothetical protein
MNPDTNKLESLTLQYGADVKQQLKAIGKEYRDVQASLLVRPDGSAVPQHWAIFTIGELVVLKNYTYRVAHMNEVTIVLEPVGPIVVGE